MRERMSRGPHISITATVSPVSELSFAVKQFQSTCFSVNTVLQTNKFIVLSFVQDVALLSIQIVLRLVSKSVN